MTDQILLSDEDFTIELFCRVDDQMKNAPKHPQATLYPSEVVTLALLFALKGTGIGMVVGWDINTANVYEGTAFQQLVEHVADEMVVFSDPGFAKQDWFPTNLKICPRGTWNDRMIIETVLSMLTTVCHFKKVGHRVWSYFKSRVGWTMALFNILVQWNGIEPDETGFVSLSIANFGL